MSNMFALLESDDEEDTPKVTTNSKTTGKANATTKKPQDNKGKSNTPAGAVVEDAPVRAEKGGRGGGGRGRGGGRGGRGSKHKEGEAVPRKREYERRSGTGRGKEVSKGGAGGRNWGNPKTEAEEAEKAPHVDEVEVTDTTAAEDSSAAVNEPPTPPEPPVFTFDEYLATRNSARTNSELFGAVSVRQVEADFSGMKTKDDTVAGSEFAAMGGAKAAKQRSKEQRAVAAKSAAVTDLGFKAPPPPEREDRPPRRENREGGGRNEGRGGRGTSGRGGRGEGRSEGRGGRGAAGRGRGAPRVDIMDANAFPSL